MIYRLLADITLILHLCFVVFVIFGGFLVLRRRFVLWLHLPALAWGILVECFQMPCPLTSLENLFRNLGGEAGYEGGFIEHYVSMLLYWHLTTQIQITLGVVLIALNLLIYFFIFQKTRVQLTNL
ncbi:MAG TPA: DUF2784 domain-containing protein [Pyrinomonadaceae bacterium]|jgi:hypothetical protein